MRSVDIFIAYAGRDQPLAEQLYDLLSPGANVFVAPRSIPPGENWPVAVSAAQQAAQMTVVLISEDSGGTSGVFQSDEVLSAIELWRAGTHAIVPLRVASGGRRPRMPYGLGQFQAREVRDDADLERAAAEIIDLLELRAGAAEAASAIDPEHEAAMNEMRSLMAALIKDFDTKFPSDLHGEVIRQVRDERAFSVHTARAFVFGQTGVGKTTTINSLLEHPVFPTTGQLTCTQSLAAGEHRHGLIFYDSPGLGDEVRQENLTRLALGLEALEDEDEGPVSRIPLIDITSKRDEGPTGTRAVAADGFAGEIDPDYYRDNRDRIAFKRLEPAAFAEWLQERLAFLVYMTSSTKGLPRDNVRLLADFERSRPATTRLFKVFNVFDDAFTSDRAKLAGGAERKLEQARGRLVQAGIPDGDDWIVVNSRNGYGLDRLIKAFAATLPVDVLRSLQQVIQRDYAYLIEDRLAEYYFDFAAHVAALVAVFPADYERKRANFLAGSAASLVTMAEYVFGGRSGHQVPADALDDLVAKLRKGKRKNVRETFYEAKPQRVPGWFSQTAMDLGFNVPEEMFGRTEVRQVRRQRVVGHYYKPGGVEAVELTMAVARALHRASSGKGTLRTSEDLLGLVDESRRDLSRQLAGDRRAQIETLVRAAADASVKKKSRVANDKLYPLVRDLC